MKCLQQPGSVIIENNNDGTRSMKTADHKKLIVTFKAENQVNIPICNGERILTLSMSIISINTILNVTQDYDKDAYDCNSIMKCGQRRNNQFMLSNSNTLPQCLPKIQKDVYLCDNCGGGYDSFPELRVRNAIFVMASKPPSNNFYDLNKYPLHI